VVSRRIDDSILPKKESPESPNKIDPIDALIQAIGAMLRSLSQTREPQVVIVGGKR
jgi:phage terminase large subunit-like protein